MTGRSKEHLKKELKKETDIQSQDWEDTWAGRRRSGSSADREEPEVLRIGKQRE